MPMLTTKKKIKTLSIICYIRKIINGLPKLMLLVRQYSHHSQESLHMRKLGFTLKMNIQVMEMEKMSLMDNLLYRVL